MPSAVLLGYDLDQPSFRHRMRTLVGVLEAAGWQVHAERFPSRRYGLRTWERRSLLRRADVVVLHQIKLSAPEARLFAAFTRRRVFDVDDAIYVRKPRRLGEAPNESLWRKKKFAATCRWVDEVAAGNDVLAGVARASARAVTVLPTSIDTAAYQTTTATAADPPTVVWIGSPENLIYLEMIRPALARLSVRHPTLKMRVICSQFPLWPEINVESIAWSSASEAGSLAAAHIGVMPLTDDAWSRGKCAFKLLQYMAAGLPCVASPVGANTEAVIDGVNGFHARTVDDWERSLQSLIESPELRARFGANGRAHVESRYAMRRYQERYLELLRRLASS
ncbi:MAG TPA: glycosyltransferase family 4 protein [Steroidobacteraceae bacterium]|jgi:glycosyltransferase involved in cell wall biosynthesis|nr:glycosyltransferase family 4 protein [Steroidobacteraceae bacterium]